MSSTQLIYDFSNSDLVLMVGGQIMFIIVVIMVLWFGTEPLTFIYQTEVRDMITKGMNSSNTSAATSGATTSAATTSAAATSGAATGAAAKK
jgi:hypothetical protein